MDCSCAPVLRQMAPQQSAKFRTPFWVNFVPVWARIANYASIWTLFSLFVSGPDALCKAVNISQIRATRFENCVRGFAKRKQSDADFAGNGLLRIVIIDIVINTVLGRVTLDPAGMHCPSRDDAFVSSVFSNITIIWLQSSVQFTAFDGSLLDAFGVSISAPTAPRFTPDLDPNS